MTHFLTTHPLALLVLAIVSAIVGTAALIVVIAGAMGKKDAPAEIPPASFIEPEDLKDL